MTRNPIMQDDGQFHELVDLLHEACNPKFSHRTLCKYCGEVDLWGFECCEDCSHKLAVEFEAEDRAAAS